MLLNKIKTVQSKIVFKKEYNLLKEFASRTKERFTLNWEDRYPCLDDKTAFTGFDSHYVYHTAWAARIVKKINPAFHEDISSYLYFSTILSAFIPVRFYDYRPANVKLDSMSTHTADLTNLLFEDNTVESLSCMHVVEHIGLGRYGDPLDYDGDLKAMAELIRVLKPEGNLLFVVPIGKPRIMFNAHRIYSFEQIFDYFSELRLAEFALIPDNAYDVGILNNVEREIMENQKYACGCFWFKK